MVCFLDTLGHSKFSVFSNDTQATDDPMAQPVLGVFSWLSWVLLPRESWCWVIPRHSTAWLYFDAVRVNYRKGMYRNLGSVRYETSTAFLAVLWAALSRFFKRNLKCGSAAAYIARRSSHFCGSGLHRHTAEPLICFLVLHKPMDVQFHCMIIKRLQLKRKNLFFP